MKKLKGFILFAMILTLSITMFTGCGEDEKTPNDSNATKNTDIGEGDETEEVTKSDIESAVLIISGNLGDKGFSDLAHAGMKKAEEKFGIRIQVVELSGDNTKQIPVLTEFAEDPNWDLVVAGTYGMKESIQKVAEEYPEAKFLVYDVEMDYSDGKLSNVYSVEHRQYETAFLAGAFAASLTTSGIENTNPEKLVGYVAGAENVSINDFLVGYIQGVQYVDNDCKVLISYVGDFTNTAKAKEMTIAQANQGADIIFSVAGGASLGVLDGAASAGVYSIGVDQDQHAALKENSPEIADQVVTSVLKRLDNTVAFMIENAINDTLEWGTHSYVGLAEDAMGLATNDHYKEVVPEDIQTFIEDTEQKLRSGEIEPESAFGMTADEITEYKDSVKP